MVSSLTSIDRWVGKSAQHEVKARSEGAREGACKLPTPGAKKSLVWGKLLATVPQTDTGRRGENPQVLVRMLVQELGKLTP
jgi:hypothetical protein